MIHSVIALIIGGVMFFGAHQRADWVKERMAKGGESFFEEQRTYRAYPGLFDPRTIRVWGATVFVLGLIGCVLAYFGA